MVNLYNWKLSWLLPKHIPTFTPDLQNDKYAIYLNIRMNCMAFTSKTLKF